MKKIILIGVLLIMILCGCSNNKNEESTKIDYTRAKTMLANGALLLDVRTTQEYEEKHIENAVLLSVDEISKENAELIIPTKDTTVIVYCRSGNRSNQALNVLKNLGYTNVYDLGSINNWQE
ncbi:MAG: rhodanese-like domain-containing protein [Bacilli bacterium]|nr:rhodanese-like domain-containing protein [Bacilli bacterium]